jgi:hypothetical protein
VWTGRARQPPPPRHATSRRLAAPPRPRRRGERPRPHPRSPNTPCRPPRPASWTARWIRTRGSGRALPSNSRPGSPDRPGPARRPSPPASRDWLPGPGRSGGRRTTGKAPLAPLVEA